MPVITLASGKGGVGKTLAAISLGAALAAEGADVALLDADPNRGAHRWATETYGRGKLTGLCRGRRPNGWPNWCQQLAERHAVLIADTAGFGNRSTVICIGAADGVLVPATPGEGDIVEAQKMVAYVAGTGEDHSPGYPGARAREPDQARHHAVPSCADADRGTRAAPARHHAVGGRCLRGDGFPARRCRRPGRPRRRSPRWWPNSGRWNGCRRPRMPNM